MPRGRAGRRTAYNAGVNRLIAIACLAALAGGASARALTGPFGPDDFATRVLAFDGANGAAGYDDPSLALGPPSELALPAIPDNTAVVSFGWGGDRKSVV